VVLRGETAYLDGKVLAPVGSGKDLRKIAPPAIVSTLPKSPAISKTKPTVAIAG
jgi:hypothetical protein